MQMEKYALLWVGGGGEEGEEKERCTDEAMKY